MGVVVGNSEMETKMKLRDMGGSDDRVGYTIYNYVQWRAGPVMVQARWMGLCARERRGMLEQNGMLDLALGHAHT